MIYRIIILFALTIFTNQAIAGDTLSLYKNNVLYQSKAKYVKGGVFTGKEYLFGYDFHLYENDSLKIVVKNTVFDSGKDSISYKFYTFDSSKKDKKRKVLEGKVKVEMDRSIKFTGINFEKLARNIKIYLILNDINSPNIRFVFKM